MRRPLLIHNGPVITLDDTVPRGAAVLVEAGRVMRVIPDAAPLPPPEQDCDVIDLEGQCLLPGFIDAHTHLFHWGLSRVRPDLSAAGSLEAALEITAERSRRLDPDSVVIAEGWDESRWRAGAYPTRAQLDLAFPERPVILRRVCGHMAVANTQALARIPPGSQVDLEKGLLVEDAAMGLARLFPPTDGDLDEAFLAAQASYHSLGVTAVHDMTTPDQLRAYRRATARGVLDLDVTAILTRPHLEILAASGLSAGWRRGPVRVWGVKFFSDGSLGARTAALETAYTDSPEGRGLLLLERKDLAEAVRRAEEARIPLAVHAIGDRAIETVVAAFEAVLPPAGSDLGHRIEHLEMPGASVLDRMRRLGLTASMQPNFVAAWGQAGGLYETRLGRERLARMNPFRRVVDSGVLLALGSDAMPAGVLYGLSGTTRAPFPEQRLSADEAIRGTTTWAARSVGDSEGGVIRPGTRADFVVLNREPPPASDLAGIEVRATIRAGRVVFGEERLKTANTSRSTG